MKFYANVSVVFTSVITEQNKHLFLRQCQSISKSFVEIVAIPAMEIFVPGVEKNMLQLK